MKAQRRRGIEKMADLGKHKDHREIEGDKALRLDRTNKGKEMLPIRLMGQISSEVLYTDGGR